MYAEQRQKLIHDAVTESGRAAVSDLAERFEVTTETIRRDLDQLAGAGLLVRVHGGAVARRTAVMEPDVATRSSTNTAAKRRIAEAARSLLPSDPSASVLLDSGTTTAALVPHLHGRTGPLLTNSVDIASSVLQLPGADLHLLPGRVRGATHAAVGADTVGALRSLQPDVAFLGCNGVSGDGFTTPDPDESAVKAAMIRSAGMRIVLADTSKILARQLSVFARPWEIDVLVTERDLPAPLHDQLTAHDIEVLRA